MKKIILLGALCLLIFQLQAQTIFAVEKKGKGQPMVLIHGLYCGGQVWEETVKHYQDHYECHILTIAGFAGNAPQFKEPFLESVAEEVAQYIKDKKLKKPILTGHSMGGFLALWIAAKNPDLLKGVVAVDGLPFLTAIMMPNATAESAKPMAANFKNTIGNLTQDQIKTNQLNYLPTMIRDQDKIDVVIEMAEKSDSKTIGQVMYEMYTTDLREAIGSIKCPVLVLGAWIAYKDYGVTHESTLKNFQSQFSKITNCKIEISDSAKHFIFYDDPAWFFEKTDGFLKNL